MFLYRRVSDLFSKRSSSNEVPPSQDEVKDAAAESEDEALRAEKETLALKKEIKDTKAKVVATRDGTFVPEDEDLDNKTSGVRKRGGKAKKKNRNILRDLALIPGKLGTPVSDDKPDVKPEVIDSNKTAKTSASRENLSLDIESPMTRRSKFQFKTSPSINPPKRMSPLGKQKPFQKVTPVKTELALAQGSASEQDDPDVAIKPKKRKSKKKSKDKDGEPKKDRFYKKNLQIAAQNEPLFIESDPISPVRKSAYSTLERKGLGNRLGLGADAFEDLEYELYMTKNKVDVNVRHVKPVDDIGGSSDGDVSEPASPRKDNNDDVISTVKHVGDEILPIQEAITDNSPDPTNEKKPSDTDNKGEPFTPTHFYNLDVIELKQQENKTNDDGTKTERQVHQHTLDATVVEPNAAKREVYVVTQEQTVTKGHPRAKDKAATVVQPATSQQLSPQKIVDDPTVDTERFKTELSMVVTDERLHSANIEATDDETETKAPSRLGNPERTMFPEDKTANVAITTMDVNAPDKYDTYSTQALIKFKNDRPSELPGGNITEELPPVPNQHYPREKNDSSMDVDGSPSTQDSEQNKHIENTNDVPKVSLIDDVSEADATDSLNLNHASKLERDTDSIDPSDNMDTYHDSDNIVIDSGDNNVIDEPVEHIDSSPHLEDDSNAPKMTVRFLLPDKETVALDAGSSEVSEYGVLDDGSPTRTDVGSVVETVYDEHSETIEDNAGTSTSDTQVNNDQPQYEPSTPSIIIDSHRKSKSKHKKKRNRGKGRNKHRHGDTVGSHILNDKIPEEQVEDKASVEVAHMSMDKTDVTDADMSTVSSLINELEEGTRELPVIIDDGSAGGLIADGGVENGSNSDDKDKSIANIVNDTENNDVLGVDDVPREDISNTGADDNATKFTDKKDRINFLDNSMDEEDSEGKHDYVTHDVTNITSSSNICDDTDDLNINDMIDVEMVINSDPDSTEDATSNQEQTNVDLEDDPGHGSADLESVNKSDATFHVIVNPVSSNLDDGGSLTVDSIKDDVSTNVQWHVDDEKTDNDIAGIDGDNFNIASSHTDVQNTGYQPDEENKSEQEKGTYLDNTFQDDVEETNGADVMSDDILDTCLVDTNKTPVNSESDTSIGITESTHNFHEGSTTCDRLACPDDSLDGFSGTALATGLADDGDDACLKNTVYESDDLKSTVASDMIEGSDDLKECRSIEEDDLAELNVNNDNIKFNNDEVESCLMDTSLANDDSESSIASPMTGSTDNVEDVGNVKSNEEVDKILEKPVSDKQVVKKKKRRSKRGKRYTYKVEVQARPPMINISNKPERLDSDAMRTEDILTSPVDVEPDISIDDAPAVDVMDDSGMVDADQLLSCKSDEATGNIEDLIDDSGITDLDPLSLNQSDMTGQLEDLMEDSDQTDAEMTIKELEEDDTIRKMGDEKPLEDVLKEIVSHEDPADNLLKPTELATGSKFMSLEDYLMHDKKNNDGPEQHKAHDANDGELNPAAPETAAELESDVKLHQEDEDDSFLSADEVVENVMTARDIVAPDRGSTLDEAEQPIPDMHVPYPGKLSALEESSNTSDQRRPSVPLNPEDRPIIITNPTVVSDKPSRRSQRNKHNSAMTNVIQSRRRLPSSISTENEGWDAISHIEGYPISSPEATDAAVDGHELQSSNPGVRADQSVSGSRYDKVMSKRKKRRPRGSTTKDEKESANTNERELIKNNPELLLVDDNSEKDTKVPPLLEMSTNDNIAMSTHDDITKSDNFTMNLEDKLYQQPKEGVQPSRLYPSLYESPNKYELDNSELLKFGDQPEYDITKDKQDTIPPSQYDDVKIYPAQCDNTEIDATQDNDANVDSAQSSDFYDAENLPEYDVSTPGFNEDMCDSPSDKSFDASQLNVDAVPFVPSKASHDSVQQVSPVIPSDNSPDDSRNESSPDTSRQEPPVQVGIELPPVPVVQETSLDPDTEESVYQPRRQESPPVPVCNEDGDVFTGEEYVGRLPVCVYKGTYLIVANCNRIDLFHRPC